MKKLKKQITAGILVLSLMMNMLPLAVFAQGGTLYGDVNRSGLVDQYDVKDLKEYLAENISDIDTVAADVNRDDVVDLQDLLLIEKYVAGFDIQLGDNVRLITSNIMIIKAGLKTQKIINILLSKKTQQ